MKINMNMKHTLLACMAWVMTSAVGFGVDLSQSAMGELARDFKNPPESTRPRCYWYQGNISRDGITHDLEAMKRVGIGEAYIGITPKAYGITNPEVLGYDFDYINAEVLMKRTTTVNDGRLILADGMSYKLLVIMPQDTMRPEVLAKIASLAKAAWPCMQRAVP
jgi:hypothetical protein